MYSMIFLTLGVECNFKCRYCLQNDNLTGHLKVSKMSGKVRKFIIDNSLALKKKNGSNAKTHIRLWGGEPLLYWDTIVEIVDDLGKDHCTFSLMSNGKLLTKDKVEYMNTHNISLTLSHDGQNTILTRLEDMLDDQRFMALFTSLDRYSISSVMSAFNTDYYAIWNYFDKKFSPYGVKIPIHVDLIMDTWNMPSDLVDIEVEQYSMMLDRVMENAYQYMLRGDTESREYMILQPTITRVKGLIDIKTDKDFNELIFPKCGATKAVANIDIDGNFYMCHNSSEKLGTVDDSHDTLLESFKPYNKYSTSEKCLDCPYVCLCTGGCFLIREGEPHERFCTLQKIFYSKVFDLLLRFK